MASSAAPHFIIVAGPNGCGKSSAGSLLAHAEFGVTPIDPDRLTSEYRLKYDAWPADAANLTAVLEAERRVWRAIAEGESVGVETVLSSQKYLPAVTSARARGFRTILLFVSVASPDVAVERVKEHVALDNGGRSAKVVVLADRGDIVWLRNQKRCSPTFAPPLRVGSARI